MRARLVHLRDGGADVSRGDLGCVGGNCRLWTARWGRGEVWGAGDAQVHTRGWAMTPQRPRDVDNLLTFDI